MQGSLEEDFAALRKLRDESERCAEGDTSVHGEDPREWKEAMEMHLSVADGRVASSPCGTCSSLAASYRPRSASSAR